VSPLKYVSDIRGLFDGVCKGYPFLCVGDSLFEGVVGCPMMGVLCVWIGNPLVNMMPRMVFTSSLHSSLQPSRNRPN